MVVAPELRADIEDPTFSPMQFFVDLLAQVRRAHQAADRPQLERIYGFAGWCLDQPEKAFWNAAGVGFYEHVFDHREGWDDVISWLTPSVVWMCMCLWESRLSTEQLPELRAKLQERSLLPS